MSPLYDELHDGNGICKYLVGNACSIYNDRPLLCKVDECYEEIFKNIISYNEFLDLNYNNCKKLQGK